MAGPVILVYLGNQASVVYPAGPVILASRVGLVIQATRVYPALVVFLAIQAFLASAVYPAGLVIRVYLANLALAV